MEVSDLPIEEGSTLKGLTFLQKLDPKQPEVFCGKQFFKGMLESSFFSSAEEVKICWLKAQAWKRTEDDVLK